MSEIIDEPRANGIGRQGDNWNACCSLLRRHRRWCAGGQNDVDVAFDQLTSEFWKRTILLSCRAYLEDEILTLNVSSFAQRVAPLLFEVRDSKLGQNSDAVDLLRRLDHGGREEEQNHCGEHDKAQWLHGARARSDCRTCPRPAEED